MKSHTLRPTLLLALASLFLIAATPFSPAGKQPLNPAAMTTVTAQTLELRNLLLQARMQMIGKPQIIRGYFSNKSVPMIVDDINRMTVRTSMPPESYILLAGTIPATVRHGDKIEVQGMVERPTAADPAHVQGEQTILKLSGTPNTIKLIEPSKLKPLTQVTPAITDQLAGASARFKLKVKPGALAAPSTNYAVLINGGLNPANYFVSFYNDLVIDYKMLIGRGYLPENIVVINANGSSNPPAAPCGFVPVHFAATVPNIVSVFNKLAAKMKPQDTLYVMITDHGGNGYIYLWGQNMPWGLFGSLINSIKNYAQMTFVLDLGHAGGAIPYVTGPNRIIYAACDANQIAYDTSHGHYGALNYAVISALTGMSPLGTPVNADTSGDGMISLSETFNYARSHIDSILPQTPHYNDDGSMPDTTLALPQTTEGTLGAGKGL